MRSRSIHGISPRIWQIASLVDCPIHYIPRTFEECGSAEKALYRIRQAEPPQPLVWIDYVPKIEHNHDVYAATREKRLVLHNTGMNFNEAKNYIVIIPRSTILPPPVRWWLVWWKRALRRDAWVFPCFSREPFNR